MLRARLVEIELRLAEVDRGEARRAMQRGEMLGPGRQTLAPPDVWVEAPPRCRAPAALEGSRGMLMACGSRQLWAGAILPTSG